MYHVIYETSKSLETSKLIFYLHCIYIIHVHTTTASIFTFPFIALGILSHLVLHNHSCMWCLVTSNKIFSLTSQKGDSIGGVDYLKMKNDVIHCKTIIFDRGRGPDMRARGREPDNPKTPKPYVPKKVLAS